MEQRQGMRQQQQSMGQNWDLEFDQMSQQMSQRLDEFNRRSRDPFRRDFDNNDGVGGSSSSSSAVRSSNGRIERQADGSLLFKVTFDVHGYGPEDLKTSLVGDRTVRVAGRAVRDDAGQQSSMSFEEQFSLPDGVDAGQLRSVVAGQQLLISAPVLPPQYAAAAAAVGSGAGLSGHQSQSQSQSQSQGISPVRPQQQQQQLHSSSVACSTTAPGAATQQTSQQQQQRRQHQQSAVTQGSDGIYRLEVHVGSEFSPADVRVSTDTNGRRLTVHARRQVKSAGKSSLREFRDEFDLPSAVDAERVAATLRSDGVVLIDAPMLHQPPPGVQLHRLPVARD